MNHLFRLAWLLLTSPWRKPLGLLDTCRTYMRVWPTDLDLLMHMNNGIYLSLMDLARVDLMVRAGGFKKFRREGIYPVLASEAIRFRASLKLGQKFFIETRVAGWDDKYVYLVQKYISKGKTCASAIVKARFLRKSGGKVSPEELWEIAGWEKVPSPLDPAVDVLKQLEPLLRE